MNDIESRLAEALAARAAEVEPHDEDDALDRIAERVNMNRRRGLTLLGIAAAVMVVVGAVALLNRDGGKKQQVNVATDSSGNTTTTANNTPASVIPSAGPAPIWPFASSTTTFATPEEAAKSFAVDYLGMTHARVGVSCCSPDTTTVEIFPNDRGNARTVVQVKPRPRGDQPAEWVVVGATADQIVANQPQPHDALTNPLQVSGQSVAFEAQVGVELRRFGSLTPVLQDFVMGGSTEMQPFSKQIAVPATDQPLVLILFEGDASGEQTYTKATVIPLAAAGSPEPTEFVAWNNSGQLVFLDFEGHVQRVLAESTTGAIHTSLDLSPTAGLAAYDDRGCAAQCRSIYFVALDGDAPSTIEDARNPIFSPDGAFLAYVDSSRTVQVRNLSTGKEAAAYQAPDENDQVARIAWVGEDALVVNLSSGSMLWVPLGGDAPPAPPIGTGALATGRGRYGTVAFWDGTNISSLNPADGSVVKLVQPAAEPTTLDADESGRNLLWVDANHDLWKWSGGDPVKVGTGFNSAAW
jgi:hypothetical protein